MFPPARPGRSIGQTTRLRSHLWPEVVPPSKWPTDLADVPFQSIHVLLMEVVTGCIMLPDNFSNARAPLHEFDMGGACPLFTPDTVRIFARVSPAE